MSKRDVAKDPRPGDRVTARNGIGGSLRVLKVVMVPTVVAEIVGDEGRPLRRIEIEEWSRLIEAGRFRISYTASEAEQQKWAGVI